MKPIILGFVGSIASGKTARVQHLLQRNQTKISFLPNAPQIFVESINCDTTAHECYAPGTPLYDGLLKEFGAQHIAPQQGQPIDRRELGKIVFGDPLRLEKLNNMVWPVMCSRVEEKIAAIISSWKFTTQPNTQEGKRLFLILIEAALLTEIPPLLKLCTDVWLVHCDPSVAVHRVIARDNLPIDQVEKRLAAQTALELRAEKVKSAQLPLQIIDTTNCATLAEGLAAVDAELETLLKRRCDVEV